MATAVTPSSASTATNDPQLTSQILNENPNGNAYDPDKLQHGLCYDAEGRLRIKPDIEDKLSPPRREMVNALLAMNRPAEANSILACQLLHKVQELCPDGHEKYVAKVSCAKLFLCPHCATPKSRAAKLRYDHPFLYQYLLHTKLSVLTLLIPRPTSRKSFQQAYREFKILMERLNAKGAHFLPAWAGGRPEITKIFVIYTGPKLPEWHKLNALWAGIVPGGAARAKLYDGKDQNDDHQKAGLYRALGGLVDYHLSGLATIHNSEVWTGFRSIIPWGSFRGFDKRIQRERLKEGHGKIETEICEDGHEHVASVKCGTCGKGLIKDNTLPLQTFEELTQDGARIYFGRSTKAIYAQCGAWLYEELRKELESDHSPPS